MVAMTATDDVLREVGPRLRGLRRKAGITLGALAETTGISVSTLSRLESGQRKATLELLLPLARAYRVPLDELVGAPQTGDPRVYARPITHGEHTILPLSRNPGGPQAFKHLIPAGARQVPDPKTHEGYEWLYVISGRLRLILGEHDLVLPAGRGGRVRHPGAALVRQRRRRSGRVPDDLRPPGRPHPRAGAAEADRLRTQ